MWALRRASNPLKNRASSIGTSQICLHARSLTVNSCLDARAEVSEPLQPMVFRSSSFMKCCHSTSTPLCCSIWKQHLSSQAGAESSGEENSVGDGFSDLDMSDNANVDQMNQKANEEELISEPELAEGEDVEGSFEDPSQLELAAADIETEVEKKAKRRGHSELFKALQNARGQPAATILDKWAEEGKDLSREEIALTMSALRRRRMYVKALQISEWMEKSNKFDFVERDYSTRLDLIFKVLGLYKAERYIEKIPSSFRGEMIYRTLLANCVSASNVNKAEAVFNKMKDLDFPISCFACNQLLLLYKRLDKKKIADVLLLMEKENIKPTRFTYNILIDTKGIANDITGMEQIVEAMKGDGIEPDLATQSIIAKHYVSAGLKEKAEEILKEMEGDNILENRWACSELLPLHASLGNSDEVGRLWKVCQANPRLDDCMAAIEAWGKLKKIEEAEAVFDQMVKTWTRLSSKHYSALLKVYANHKMLIKGKDLVKRMGDNGCQIGPLTWDALVKLYVDAGEVEKADSLLQKAINQKQLRPMFSSFMSIMDHYSMRGDVHNSEKIFHRMRQAGYVARLRQFQALIQAYINAKAPAYGMRERMKADNVFPNKALAGQLALVDAFRKTAVSELLE